MSLEEDRATFEHTLLVVQEVSIYKILPRPSSYGYKCGGWLQSDKIWSRRLWVVSCKVGARSSLRTQNQASYLQRALSTLAKERASLNQF